MGLTGLDLLLLLVGQRRRKIKCTREPCSIGLTISAGVREEEEEGKGKGKTREHHRIGPSAMKGNSPLLF